MPCGRGRWVWAPLAFPSPASLWASQGLAASLGPTGRNPGPAFSALIGWFSPFFGPWDFFFYWFALAFGPAFYEVGEQCPLFSPGLLLDSFGSEAHPCAPTRNPPFRP